MKDIIAIVPSDAAVDRWYRALDGKSVGGPQPWIAEVIGVHVEGPWRWVQIRPRHAPLRELVLTFAEPLSVARAIEALKAFRFDPAAPYPQLVTVPLMHATTREMGGAPVSLESFDADPVVEPCVGADQPTRVGIARRGKVLRRDDCIGRDAWVSSAVWPDLMEGNELPGRERRQFRRAQVSLTCRVAGDGGAGESRVIDVSLGGCQIETLVHPARGETVTIVFAENASGMTHVMGTVVHASPGRGFSLQFGPLDRATRLQLASLLRP